ncbi:MAG: cyclic nucleotide-binding domain-containing protein [Deltaproteobacteria bacterium]
MIRPRPPTRDSLMPLYPNATSISEMRTMLDGAQMFRDFDWPQIEALSAYIKLFHAAPGTVVFREGDRGDFMCVVLKGQLDIRKQDANSVERSVATVAAGRSLGEMALVDSEARSATAVVMEFAVLAVLTQEDLQLITRDTPALAVKIVLKIAQMISQRLRSTSGILVEYLGK